MIPTCTNIAVTMRHHSPCTSTEPALFAPHCMSCSGVGFTPLTCLSSIIMNTATLIPTSTYVAGAVAQNDLRLLTTGCGVGIYPGSGRRISGSGPDPSFPDSGGTLLILQL